MYNSNAILIYFNMNFLQLEIAARWLLLNVSHETSLVGDDRTISGDQQLYIVLGRFIMWVIFDISGAGRYAERRCSDSRYSDNIKYVTYKLEAWPYIRTRSRLTGRGWYRTYKVSLNVYTFFITINTLPFLQFSVPNLPGLLRKWRQQSRAIVGRTARCRM